MRTNSIAIALGLCAVMLLATAAPAQSKKTTKRHVVRHHVVRHVARKKVSAPTSGAETGLAGVKLFDTGTRVIAIYGSPDVIEAVTLGGGTAGPGGGAAGGAGGRNLPPGTPAAAGGANATATHPSIGDFDFGDSVLDRQGRSMKPGGGGGGAGVFNPATGGAGGGGGGTGGSGGAGGLGGSSDRIMYTRWVYNRNASKYGFIVDRFNRVVQCEAIGIQSGKAKTRRGITFGSTFAQIINKYGAPDGYEISGDNIVVRYLSKAKCAFRMNRLGENKPDVVTGIVVAAGKR